MLIDGKANTADILTKIINKRNRRYLVNYV